tara:strand:+ start:8 stop:406 length:399 start_codon:yes stop_codon:yes gene_type:complete
MPVTDPIADMLAILKTGVLAHKESVIVKKSRLAESVMEILKREGFISNYKAVDDNKQGIIKVYLKYEKDKTSYLRGVKRISKPGRRVYVKNDEIKSVFSGIGIALVSTSQGVMTGKEAKDKKIGGEILCNVW